MATFAAALRTEIRRLAAKDMKRTLHSVRRMQRQLTTLRLVNSGQQRTITNLERKLAKVQEKVRLRGKSAVPAQGRPRIQPTEIHSIRKRLGLSRLKFAKLVGVSPGSIFGWEHGRTQPRGESVVRLRKLEKQKDEAGPSKKRAAKKTPAPQNRAQGKKARRLRG
ncbi:MAG: helix-turn-helix domain-containing protein [Vicinamibacteria bacterium]|nr:helix-turn-helix domain-containing protein [Vicinamibacteria bacterium]